MALKPFHNSYSRKAVNKNMKTLKIKNNKIILNPKFTKIEREDREEQIKRLTPEEREELVARYLPKTYSRVDGIIRFIFKGL